MTLKTKRRLYLVAGSVFFVLGILGLFLPILQGALFLLVALVLLAKAHPRFRLLKQKLRRRYPKYADILRKAEKRAVDIAHGRFFNRK
ncbi:MAG: DUF454 family protein [Alphaproteobacteria bacterium]|jgi:uncharacterized membrane protein YbaN (DUF454 family)|nr:DUF454 family protein [Alphaproteobacteria bacterium]